MNTHILKNKLIVTLTFIFVYMYFWKFVEFSDILFIFFYNGSLEAPAWCAGYSRFYWYLNYIQTLYRSLDTHLKLSSFRIPLMDNTCFDGSLNLVLVKWYSCFLFFPWKILRILTEIKSVVACSLYMPFSNPKYIYIYVSTFRYILLPED